MNSNSAKRAGEERSSPRVLLIEDDSASMELMLYLLRSYGFTTIFAFDAEDGLRLARSTAPDLVLCDVSLPGMSGLGFLRATKDIDDLHNVPIIAMTGMAMPGDKQRLLSLGFDGYLSKPIETEDLYGYLMRYLAPPA